MFLFSTFSAFYLVFLNSFFSIILWVNNFFLKLFDISTDFFNSVPKLWFSATDNTFFFSLTTVFFWIVLGSLALGFLFIVIRWNFLNNVTWDRFIAKFPVQFFGLGYNILLFLLSLCILYFSGSAATVFTMFPIDSLVELLLFYQWQVDVPMVVKLSQIRALWHDSILTFWSLKMNLALYFNHYQTLPFSKFWIFVHEPFFLCNPELVPRSLFANQFDNLSASMLNVVSTQFFDNFFNSTASYFTIFVPSVSAIFQEPFAFTFSMDGLSLIFIVLTTFIISLCFIVSWFSYKQTFAYTITLLLLLSQFFVIFVFSTLDLILFYLAFESVLIPLFFLVGIFGSRERRIKAAYYLMFYTLVGSLPLLLGILYIWFKTGQTNILLLEPLLFGMFSSDEMSLLWFLFLPGFAFKVPLYPFHLWLPEAHVEAPTIGSVILAGLVLKLGGYGFIRFSIGLFYWGGVAYLNIIYWLCFFSMLAAMLCAACQIDLKRIIAYGSVSHMGLVTLCIFLGSQIGLESAMIMMLGHGFVSSALFILVGGLYERYHSRNIRYYGGLYKTLPKYGSFFLLFVLFDIGVPGSPSFVAELLAFIGVVQESVILAVAIILPTVLGAGVSLLVCSRVLFGLNERRYFLTLPTLTMNFFYWLDLSESRETTSRFNSVRLPITSEYILARSHDFLKNELFVLFCLFSAALLLGIYPQVYLQYFNMELENILQITLN